MLRKTPTKMGREQGPDWGMDGDLEIKGLSMRWPLLGHHGNLESCLPFSCPGSKQRGRRDRIQSVQACSEFPITGDEQAKPEGCTGMGEGIKLGVGSEDLQDSFQPGKSLIQGVLVQVRPTAAGALQTFRCLMSSRFLTHVQCHQVGWAGPHSTCQPGLAAQLPQHAERRPCVLCWLLLNPPSPPLGDAGSLSSQELPEGA